MRVATWNVNSLRVRLPQVIDWLQQQTPDVLCLQETKLVDADFPVDDIRAAGYEVAYTGQKTYNGVAMLAKAPLQDTVAALPGWDDPQQRFLAATVCDIRVVNVYIPNGAEVGSEKFVYKLDWLQALNDFLNDELQKYKNLILLGDFNIAPESRDVYDPELLEDSILCSAPERTAFQELLKLGLRDVFRRFDQAPQSFSWWDYRAAAFRRNRGLRIDHILCSDSLYDACRACVIDKKPRGLERPSDHAPVLADFND